MSVLGNNVCTQCSLAVHPSPSIDIYAVLPQLLLLFNHYTTVKTRLQAKFQAKQLEEKEEKLIHMLEEKQVRS